mgnify:CR=1 FL=1
MQSTKITGRKKSFSAREAIFRLYRNRCLVNPAHTGIVVHEIVPKSQRPNNWWEFENKELLCHECHDMIHNDGAANWEEKLTNLRAEWIKKYA